MTDNIVFLNDSWLLPVLIGWSLLLIVFLWKEWSVSRSKRIGLRAILVLVALSSLALIALKPATPEYKKEESLVILTENFNKKHLDSVKQLFKNIKLLDYTKGENLMNAEYAKETFVLGDGIKPYDLWAFQNSQVNYLAGDSLSGIIKLKAPNQVEVGNRIEVIANYQNPTPGNRIVLESPAGQALDSVVFQSKSDSIFKLSSELKVAGNFVFNLAEKDSLGNLLRDDPLPVKVTEQKELRLLMLNAFPTFQMKYLKNFLAEKGHQVIVKNRITKGKYKYEFLNTKRINLNRLTLDKLSDFDLVIADARSLKAFSRIEDRALKQAIEEEGLGLLLLDGVNEINSFKGFSNLNFQSNSNSKIRLENPVKVEVSTQAFRLKPELGQETIHNHETGILSAYKRRGLGRVGVTVFQDTWQLQLSGQLEVYQIIWSKLIETLSKPDYAYINWEFDEKFPVVHEPLSVEIKTSISKPEIIQNKEQIPLKQDFHNQQLWSGMVYPREIGWQNMRLSLDTGLYADYYVYSENDWKTLKSYQTRQVNRSYFNRTSNKNQDVQKFPKAINPLWFFVVFLLAIGGLWLEPKL